MTNINNITGVIGGTKSQFGDLQAGYDPDNYTSVDWIANAGPNIGEIEQTFGFDEGSRPIIVFKNISASVTQAQLQQMLTNKSVLLEGARFGISYAIRIFEIVQISDIGFASVARTNGDVFSISDSAGKTAIGTMFSRFAYGTRISALQLGQVQQPGTTLGQIGVTTGNTPETVKFSDAATHSPHS